MKRVKMILGILIFIFALPVMTSHLTAAYAGHTIAGGRCDCGDQFCVCDPGEQPGLSARPVSDTSPTSHKAERVYELDFGSGALLIALAFLVWTRMRA